MDSLMGLGIVMQPIKRKVIKRTIVFFIGGLLGYFILAKLFPAIPTTRDISRLLVESSIWILGRNLSRKIRTVRAVLAESPTLRDLFGVLSKSFGRLKFNAMEIEIQSRRDNFAALEFSKKRVHVLAIFCKLHLVKEDKLGAGFDLLQI